MQVRLTRYLERYLHNSDKMGQVLPNVTNLTPIHTSNRQLQQWNRLHATLHTSVSNILHDFHNDKDIQNILNLSPKELNIIENCNKYQSNHTSYNIGSFRPDLLIEQHTQKTKVCEINARFTLNGYVMTQCLSHSLNEINETYKKYDYPKYNALFNQHFDYENPIFIIKGKEYGNDIYLFKLFNESMVHIININDIQLDQKTKALYTFIDDQKTEIQQIILELHQNELLSLPESILDKFCEMSCNQTLLNDLRTIFVVHNKKLLKILSDKYLMKRYLTGDEFSFLNEFLLKSYCKLDIINNKQLLDEIIVNKNNFILKPILLGKGEGIIFGDECLEDEWYSYIKELVLNWNNEYIIQEHIKQEQFEFYSIIKCDSVKQNIIPTLLCYNDQFYGPGIFRTSPERLIAVSRGGEILLPQIMDSMDSNFQIPNEQTPFTQVNESHMSENECKMIGTFDGEILEHSEYKNINTLSEKIMNVLKKDQKCLVKICDDENSLIMQNIVNEMGEPHIHCKNDIILWDVKVMNGENYIARSHNDKEFELHSDASFDVIVPRYFGLHVICEDKLDGGLNQLISIDDIIEKLTQYEIDQLLSCIFKIKIPVEFVKDDGIEYSYGKLLSFDKVLNKYIMRYRKDIICRNDLNKNQMFLLNKLENVLEECQNKAELIRIPENSILFVDNCCYLHSRTQIKDKNRHLRRMRFHPKQLDLIPNFS